MLDHHTWWWLVDIGCKQQNVVYIMNLNGWFAKFSCFYLKHRSNAGVFFSQIKREMRCIGMWNTYDANFQSNSFLQTWKGPFVRKIPEKTSQFVVQTLQTIHDVLVASLFLYFVLHNVLKALIMFLSLFTFFFLVTQQAAHTNFYGVDWPQKF